MNLFIATGNLTRDPETRTTANGKARCTFTLAVNRDYRDASGAQGVDFILFSAYGKTAEICQKYLQKGKKVLVHASVRTGSYMKDGKRVYSSEHMVSKVEFLSTAREEAQPDSALHAPAQSAPAQQQTADDDYPAFDAVGDDELPF